MNYLKILFTIIKNISTTGLQSYNSWSDNTRCIWFIKEQIDWYIDKVLLYYHYYKVYVPKTRSKYKLNSQVLLHKTPVLETINEEVILVVAKKLAEVHKITIIYQLS